VTRSDSRMPLEDWLVQDQIVELDAYHTSQEIGLFLEKVMTYHSQAYNYEIGERQRQIRRGAAEHLALGMRSDKLSIRSVVRLSVELFDLLFLYPEYEVAVLLDELRKPVDRPLHKCYTDRQELGMFERRKDGSRSTSFREAKRCSDQ